MVMHLPVALAGVSSAVNDILDDQFRRSPLTIPNGIDCEKFRPGPRCEALQPTSSMACELYPVCCGVLSAFHLGISVSSVIHPLIVNVLLRCCHYLNCSKIPTLDSASLTKLLLNDI